MKIEISSKVKIDLDKDIRKLSNDLIYKSADYDKLYGEIYNYCKVLRLKTTSYPYVLTKSTSGDTFIATKIIIETHSGSMIEDDSLLIREFNI